MKSVYVKDMDASPISEFFEVKFKEKNIISLFRGVKYDLLECAQCELLYQKNILDEEHTEKLYNEWLLDSDAEGIEEGLDLLRLAVYNAQEIAMLVRTFRRPASEVRVLDYGLGRGRWCQMAKAFGFDVHGTDLSDRLMESAMRNGIKTIPMDEVNNHQFHYINTEQVFEHLPAPLDKLKSLRDSLLPGGVIKISVPDAADIKSRLPQMDWREPRTSKQFLVPVTPLNHINAFNMASIVKMGRVAGFRPYGIPLRNFYTILDSASPVGLAKSLFRPIYRKATHATYVFLEKC